MLDVGRTVGWGDKLLKCSVVGRQVDTCVAYWVQVAKWDGVINFSNAQWSSGRHRCGMLVLGRTVQ